MKALADGNQVPELVQQNELDGVFGIVIWRFLQRDLKPALAVILENGVLSGSGPGIGGLSKRSDIQDNETGGGPSLRIGNRLRVSRRSKVANEKDSDQFFFHRLPNRPGQFGHGLPHILPERIIRDRRLRSGVIPVQTVIQMEIIQERFGSRMKPVFEIAPPVVLPKRRRADFMTIHPAFQASVVAGGAGREEKHRRHRQRHFYNGFHRFPRHYAFEMVNLFRIKHLHRRRIIRI
jgi:hypothetical protein